MNEQGLRGLQQGAHRGVWYQEDIHLLDIHCRSKRGTFSLMMSFNIRSEDIYEDMRVFVDNKWAAIKDARQRRKTESWPVDDIPWEIHDIDDPVAREVATAAYLGNRVG